MKYKIYNKFCIAIVRWLADRAKLDSNLIFYLESQLEKFFLIQKTRGTLDSIRFNKERRASIFRFLSRYSLNDINKPDMVFPKELKILKHCKSSVIPFIKLLLTIYYVSRAFRTKAIPSLSTIKGPSEMKVYPFKKKDFELFWLSLGYSKRLSPERCLDFKHYHKTSKAGPNGPALWNCFSDLLSMDDNLFSNIKILGGKKLSQYLNLLVQNLSSLSSFFNSTAGKTRKLVVFADREGKTREVAIFDYFSQTSLIPLHNYLSRALKKIPQDYTFDQTGFMSTLSTSKVFYSIDLTAFTDRFPIQVNRDLLEVKIGPERANAWFQIMTQPFTYEQDTFSYSTGNPMGAYSSWNSTTLSHHFVVWKACINLNIKWKTLPYAMLGDDLVIGHREVALEYCRLIRCLGVHWSKEKTHVSPHFFEFAKRLHWCGFDISPFPIAGLWSERSNIVGQLQVLDNAMSKGWFSASECLGSLDDYFSFRGYPRRLRTKWVNLMTKAWTIMSILQKKSSALELIPFVEKISSIVASKLDENKIFNILVSSIMLTFVESSSNILDKSKHKDTLGQFAEDIVMFCTCLDTDPESDSSIFLPEAIPQTHAWGVVSEDYLRAQKEAYIIDTIRGGDWNPLLKNLKIPISDKSFYFNRKVDLLYIHSFEILDKFDDNIRQLAMYPQLI